MLTKEFITAGKAIFTLDVPASFQQDSKCKGHYTYKVNFKKGQGQWKDTWFIALLSGPDNTADYRYLGMLDTDKGNVILTKKSQFNDSTYPVMLLRRVVACLWEKDGSCPEDIEAAGFTLHHAGRCGRCGRLLTVVSSIESGLGEVCASKMGL